MQRQEYALQTFVGLVRTMRPKQWTKNFVIYAGLVFDGQLLILDSLLRTTVGFVLLCAIASTVYIINDLVDIESDRQHPTKRNRALPSGQLPVPVAVLAAGLLPTVTLIVAVLLSPRFAIVLAAYLVLQILYSFSLKQIVILDVMAIAAGFLLRVAAGIVVISGVAFSPWLFSCVGLLALFLAISKRRGEYVMLGETAGEVRNTLGQYNLALLDDMMRLALTTMLMTYILYTIDAETAKIANINTSLATVPFVIYGVFRYLYLMHVKGEGSAPDEVLLRDRPLQIAIVLWGVMFVVLLYIVG